MEPELAYFPVQYPAGFNAATYSAHRVPTTPREQNAKLAGIEIAFENSFPGRRGTAGHNAIDIHGAIGLNILSTTNGWVAKRWVLNGQRLDGVNAVETDDAGFFVVIVDDNHFFHHYAHLREPAIPRPGARIRAGEQIGFLGMTGKARRNGVPHLHYQIRRPLRDSTGHDYVDLVFQGQGADPVNPYLQLKDLAVRLGAQPIKSRDRLSRFRFFIPAPPTPGAQPRPLMGWQVPG